MNTTVNAYAMDIPLLLKNLLEGAARHHRQGEIVSVIQGKKMRHTYGACELRARKLAQSLLTLGIQPGDRVATLAWNDHRHFELYFGITGIAAICHTVNPRLFAEQIVYIINDAQDVAMFYSHDFAGLVEQLKPQCPSVQHWIPIDDAHHPDTPGYEALLTQQTGDMVWPEFDERNDAFLCYTSGTTGNPKGVIYTHRGTVLHAYAVALPDAHNVSAMSVLMPVVPMFHANAWEAPFSAALAGAKLVLPGSQLDGESLYRLMESEGVTLSIGVPTVWFNVLTYLQQNHLRCTSLKRLLLGGSSTPLSMIEAYAGLGVLVTQGWGMTETAAMTTSSQPLAQHRDVPIEALQRTIYQTAGRAVAGGDIRTVDEQGAEIPWGSGQPGELQVRAPWAIQRYFRADKPAITADGWLPTGDIALIDAEGFMRLTDRSKDVIKSGGEWISSVELENLAMALKEVQYAACIAAQHERWGERPLLVVQLHAGCQLSEADILQSFEGKIAKWWTPDGVVFVDQIPMTATGKLSKLELRHRFGRHLLDSAGTPTV